MHFRSLFIASVVACNLAIAADVPQDPARQTSWGLYVDSKEALQMKTGGDGKGYKQVDVVVDGFEGDTVKEGDKKNWRLVNGWKNSGLPWSYSLNKSKMYPPQ
jgi:hypothetical protein